MSIIDGQLRCHQSCQVQEVLIDNMINHAQPVSSVPYMVAIPLPLLELLHVTMITGHGFGDFLIRGFC